MVSGGVIDHDGILELTPEMRGRNRLLKQVKNESVG
jgi:hypothetical protein